MIVLDAAIGALKFDTEPSRYPQYLLDEPVRARIAAGEENDTCYAHQTATGVVQGIWPG